MYGGWFMSFRIIVFSRRKGATRKPAKWWLFRVFAWRPFAPPHGSMTLFMRRLLASCLSYLCLAGKRGHAKTRQNHHLVGFSRGDLSPRQAKTRKGAKRKPAIWWKSLFGRFSRGDFSRFLPENTLIRHGTNQPPYYMWCYYSMKCIVHLMSN